MTTRQPRSSALPASFYARAADELAPALLGKVLSVTGPDGTRCGRIVETEAYVGEGDLACHASRGRTGRTQVLYREPGTIYVYLIYGMYHLFNVVAAEVGQPHAVLVRAVEPEAGVVGRTDGPGRLTRALGIDLRHNGQDLFTSDVSIQDGPSPVDIGVGPRVGVDYAGAWKDAALRFFDRDSRFVSKPPAPRRSRHRRPEAR